MGQPHIIDLSFEIELLTHAMECVGQKEPCDYSSPTLCLLGDLIRQRVQELRNVSQVETPSARKLQLIR
ncbi:MAG TPA: hypothetical protein VKK81_27755 [Candidatus Binatia bacterium]|nr:hypothetical protein [Candidatus Binatia bacterium]